MVDFARALLRAWRAILGSLPTKEQAGVLWAHFAGETGDGKYCWAWNLGNAKYARGCGTDYVALAGVWEGVSPATAERLVAGGQWAHDPSADHAAAVGPGRVSIVATRENPASWFRAYGSLEEGMRAFVESKRNAKSRYAPAWAHVERGDPDGYARTLGRLGYYTASPDVYARAMRAKHAAWMASPAFDEALGELVAASEAETQPELPDVPDPESTRIVDFDVVHGRVPLGRPSLDDLDDPGEEPVS